MKQSENKDTTGKEYFLKVVWHKISHELLIHAVSSDEDFMFKE